MKKFLSVILALAMLLSLSAALAVTTSAVDGEWMVYSSKGQYEEDFEGDKAPVPGYEYTDEGFRVIPADWRDFNASFGLQTKDKVNLKEGVYMLIRIDEFDYVNDRWFNINLWNEPMVAPGSKDVERYGYGVQNLIRSSNDGKVTAVNWHYNGFDSAGAVNMTNSEEERYDAEGRVLLELTVTWDGTDYVIDINGSKAPEAVTNFAKEAFPDGEAYVGFNVKGGVKGGTAGVTVLKFGTNKESAIPPLGDDSKEPENYYIEIAEPGDPNDIPAGQPGIFFNGSPETSDSKTTHGKSSTGSTSLNDDHSVHIVASSANVYESFGVKNEVSYLAEDFPVALTLTRNYCTCGTDDGSCYALEDSKMYFMFGDLTSATEGYTVSSLEMCYDPIVKDDDTYLYFYTDLREDASFDVEGRINGCRFDFSGVEYTIPGKNAFDICFVAFFRSVEDAEAFALDWIGIETETTETETELVTETPDTETEVDAPETNTETTDPDPETQAPDPETQAPDPETEKKPVASEEKPDDSEKETSGEQKPADTQPTGGDEGGCKSAVGFGAIAVVSAIAACGIVSFRKKED